MDSKMDSKWSIIVKTGDHKGSGTDANVFVVFYDKNGRRSKDIKLDVVRRNDFKRGKEETFSCEDLNNNKISTPCTMELWRDNSGIFTGPSWYCEVITLQTGSGEKLAFPILRWVEVGVHYKIPVYDTSLPQDDPFPEQRTRELEVSRERYKISVPEPGHPVRLETVPEEEHYSDDAKREINDAKKKILLGVIVGKLDFRKMTKFEHLERLYRIEGSFPKPKASEFWQSDEWFAAQRLNGTNPMTIELCTKIPKNFGVSDELLAPYLEEFTLEGALEEKRLFIVDYHSLDGIIPKKEFYICAPLALFFLNSKQKLMPVAIQLFQDKSNPVFTPGIDSYKWTLAKMWFNFTDATYHQFWFHVANTHLAMESIIAPLHMCLSKNHPVFRLLAPHFLYMLAVRKTGLVKVVSPGGFFDKMMGTGVKAGNQFIARLWKNWRIDVSSTLPAQLKSRGVDDPSVLPEYPYRDDGLLVYNAIKEYVTDIVNIYYDSDDTVSSDSEIQHWAEVLATPEGQGGAGVKGIPNDGVFRQKSEIVLVCTAIIFTCSAQHAAVNFSQYDQYGFIPNYPSVLRGAPPTNTDPITEEEVMEQLGEKDALYEMLTITKIFSTRTNNPLGNWEVRSQYDPRALEVEDRFRDSLKAVDEKINSRNAERHDFYKYDLLKPENIPNSISI